MTAFALALIVAAAQPPSAAPPAPAGPRGPRGNPRGYFTNDDYPASALRAEEEGTTSFRLDIGPDGRVAECTVTGSSGSAALDAATCRILRARARYAPARDAAGNPIAGRDHGRIAWRIEGDSAGETRFGIPVPARRAIALAPLGSYIRPGDYPYTALRARQSGWAKMDVVVSPTGRVIACDVVRYSGSPVLDAAACRILRARARYRPARDAAGAAVCDVDQGVVQWTLPRRILIPYGRPGRAVALTVSSRPAPGACPAPRP